MPELPDVEVFRRYLVRHAGGADIVEVEVRDSRCLDDIAVNRFEELLAGTQFGQTRRHGKHLFVGLKPDRWLVLHFGMTGFLQRVSHDEDPDYSRIAFHLAGGGALHYILKRMLGRVGITGSPETFIGEHDLGPDALELDSDAFDELLQLARGGVKSLLMNQARIAGIGNIYSDEMLFQAGIHPGARCGDLDAEARGRLDVARQAVLETAIEREADPERLPREWLIPHREAGGRCPRCGGTIRREVINGRGSYVCTSHQKR
ncbi:MAG: Fpg/Nei family DNA glycosylase [Spirochaetaceae bacterium]